MFSLIGSCLAEVAFVGNEFSLVASYSSVGSFRGASRKISSL